MLDLALQLESVLDLQLFSQIQVRCNLSFIQTKAIYLPGHNLKTGDQVTYSTGIGTVKGSGIIVQDETNVGVGTTLADGSSLFVAKITMI